MFAKISVEILKANIIDDKNCIINEIDEMKIQQDSSSIQNTIVLENSFGSLFLTKPQNLINVNDNQSSSNKIENLEKTLPKGKFSLNNFFYLILKIQCKKRKNTIRGQNKRNGL